MISLRSVLWILTGAMVLASAANAQVVLYGNLYATVAAFDGVNSNGPLYNSFSTGSSPVTLTDVKLQLDLIDTGGIGTISVGLYADSSTTPGSLLQALGTLSDSSLTLNVGGTFDFPVSPGFALAANTRYWIGLSTANNSLSGWATTTSTAESGGGTDNIFNEWTCQTSGGQPALGRPRSPGSAFRVGLTCQPNGTDPFLMQIGGTIQNPASVPTLSTWGMLGLALLLMASAAFLIRGAQLTAG
jgi:hypothetical protein